MSQKFLNKPGFAHFWERLRVLFGGLDTRVTALEQSGGEANIIDSISFNGTNVPPDASKNVALVETDPTVPAWAKAQSKPTYTAQEVGALPYPLIISTGDISQADNGVSQDTGLAIYIKDSQDEIVGGVEFGLSPNGDVFADIMSRNNVNGSMQRNMIKAIISKSGVKTYNITDGESYRSAIGAQSDIGFYIDAQGYVCQRISSDT